MKLIEFTDYINQNYAGKLNMLLGMSMGGFVTIADAYYMSKHPKFVNKEAAVMQMTTKRMKCNYKTKL